MHILRNIAILFRRHGALMTLNLAGLVLAFCAFIAIMERVRYENSYDRFYPDSDRIFRVDQEGVEGTFHSVLPPGFADAVIKSSPHIVAGTLWCPFAGEQYVVVTDSLGQEHGFRFEVNNVSGGVFDVFGIDVLEGDRNALYEPDKVAIPESMARKMFGDSPAVGRHLDMRAGAGFLTWTDWTVGAVYRDIPANSQLRNNILIPVPEFFLQNFSASNFLCWLRLDDASSAEDVAEDFNSHFDFSVSEYLSHIGLTPVRDIYYLEEGSDSRVFRSGSRTRTGIMTVVAVLVLLAGTFNYTNFYASLIPSRIRSINTRKVFGASGASLRRDIFLETSILGIIAWAVSCVIMHFACHAGLSPGILALSLSSAILCGVLSGIYPGLFATSFQPAAVLNGGSGLPAGGRVLKKVLLAVQLAVSSGLVIFVVHVWLQNRMMSGYDTGFDRDRVMVVELTSGLVGSKGDWFRNEIRKYAGLEDVAFAMETVGGQEVYSTETMEWRGRKFQAFTIWCSDNFHEVMGIPVSSGRHFTRGEYGSMIMNASARDAYGLELGGFPSGDSEIVGFCDDVIFSSLRRDNIPVCFISAPPDYTSVAYIRLSPDADRVKAARDISDVVRRMDPSLPCDVLTYDTVLAGLYAQEREFQGIVLLFSILAVLLSLMGIFSMVLFDMQYARREIALRRVCGAGRADVVRRANAGYLAIVLVGFLAAIPAAWLAVSSWMDNFAVRTGFGIWVPAASLAAVSLLVTAVVSVVSYRASGTSPARVLRED